jgi:glycosyltransferase involved in cell wall biosynthesis
MKLCIIADANSIHTVRWLDPYIAHGDEVYLISYRSTDRPYHGVRELIDLNKLSHTAKLRWLFWGLWIRRYVHQIRADVLHAHQIQAAGWLGYLADYHPFVVSSWGSDLLIEPNKSQFRRFLVLRVLSQCDRLTVPSSLMQEKAINLGVPEKKISLIPWGIDTRTFSEYPDDKLLTRQKLGLEKDIKVVFCPRGISPIYNIDIAILALKNALDQHINIRLLLLQFNVDQFYFKDIQKLISNEGLQQYIYWLPAQNSEEDMARLYRTSDVFLSIPQSEGYGASVYEAMACGCPTLISDLPVFKEALAPGIHTLKVPPRDVKQTSSALSDLLMNENLQIKLKENGLRLARSRSTQELAATTELLYQELVKQRHLK